MYSQNTGWNYFNTQGRSAQVIAVVSLHSMVGTGGIQIGITTVLEKPIWKFNGEFWSLSDTHYLGLPSNSQCEPSNKTPQSNTNLLLPALNPKLTEGSVISFLNHLIKWYFEWKKANSLTLTYLIWLFWKWRSFPNYSSAFNSLPREHLKQSLPNHT